jgi:transcriptional regulator with XRE-family HTH domain
MRVRLKRGAVEMVILRRNLTKTALARLAGLHRTHLSDLLAGRTAPGPQTRQRLLDVLGGAFDDYFEVVRVRGRVSDAERVQQLLGAGRGRVENDASGTRDRLLRMRDTLQIGLPLAPEDRVWLDVEWRSTSMGKRGGRTAPSAHGRPE